MLIIILMHAQYFSATGNPVIKSNFFYSWNQTWKNLVSGNPGFRASGRLRGFVGSLMLSRYIYIYICINFWAFYIFAKTLATPKVAIRRNLRLNL
jgi:hypothetical protein